MHHKLRPTIVVPRIDDLLSSLAGARVFTKLDLAHAYLQLALDEESKKLVTVSTHKGLFRNNRLPFGVASAPAIFQRVIEGILSGIHHVYAYMDDVLVANDTEAEHLSTFSWRKSWHVRSRDGVRPTQEKLQAIVDAPAPKDVSQLKSFLGLVNYYSKFLPHLANTLAPLYALLKKTSAMVLGS
ncbi:hypothetical protein EMCRGX_G004492 [Ephydatia muelleri]